MPAAFTTHIIYDRKQLLAVILPHLRQDGMHYEVNINGFPRFHMAWSPLGRYDVVNSIVAASLPWELILAVSDAIETQV